MNFADIDEMPQNAISHLGLHFLQIAHLHRYMLTMSECMLIYEHFLSSVQRLSICVKPNCLVRLLCIYIQLDGFVIQ